ncbi:MAG: prepilin-type N-terminal cleavage/methylation domain-containing protein, partial [Burkholderiales bacterium]
MRRTGFTLIELLVVIA